MRPVEEVVLRIPKGWELDAGNTCEGLTGLLYRINLTRTDPATQANDDTCEKMLSSFSERDITDITVKFSISTTDKYCVVEYLPKGTTTTRSKQNDATTNRLFHRLFLAQKIASLSSFTTKTFIEILLNILFLQEKILQSHFTFSMNCTILNGIISADLAADNQFITDALLAFQQQIYVSQEQNGEMVLYYGTTAAVQKKISSLTTPSVTPISEHFLRIITPQTQQDRPEEEWYLNHCTQIAKDLSKETSDINGQFTEVQRQITHFEHHKNATEMADKMCTQQNIASRCGINKLKKMEQRLLLLQQRQRPPEFAANSIILKKKLSPAAKPFIPSAPCANENVGKNPQTCQQQQHATPIPQFSSPLLQTQQIGYSFPLYRIQLTASTLEETQRFLDTYSRDDIGGKFSCKLLCHRKQSLEQVMAIQYTPDTAAQPLLGNAQHPNQENTNNLLEMSLPNIPDIFVGQLKSALGLYKTAEALFTLLLFPSKQTKGQEKSSISLFRLPFTLVIRYHTVRTSCCYLYISDNNRQSLIEAFRALDHRAYVIGIEIKGRNDKEMWLYHAESSSDCIADIVEIFKHDPQQPKSSMVFELAAQQQGDLSHSSPPFHDNTPLPRENTTRYPFFSCAMSSPATPSAQQQLPTQKKRGNSQQEDEEAAAAFLGRELFFDVISDSNGNDPTPTTPTTRF